MIIPFGEQMKNEGFFKNWDFHKKNIQKNKKEHL